MPPTEALFEYAGKLVRRAGGVNPPAEVTLAWPRPNYVNPETHDWSGTVVVVIFLVFAIAVFGARMWARLVVAKNAGLDDLLIALAMVPLIGSTVATILAIRIYGFQWHSWDQTSLTYVTSRQMSLAIEILYLGATAMTKISILCFYRRMTSGSISRTFVYWVWASIAFVIAYFIAFFFAVLFTCTPIEGYWRLYDIVWRLQHEVKCNNEGVVIVAVVVVSTVQDFLICALPVLLVWNLQIPKRQKIALVALFGVGLLTCICGVMRTYYAIYVYYGTYDITWYAYYGWIWTSVEADLGVVCASAPALKIFFNRYFAAAVRRTGYGSSALSRSGYGKQTSYGKGSQGGGSLKTFGSPDYEHGKWDATSMPLDRIQVHTGMNVVVEDREDAASTASDSSIRNLTALPLPQPSPGEPSPQWGSRTTCEAGSQRPKHIEIQARTS